MNKVFFVKSKPDHTNITFQNQQLIGIGSDVINNFTNEITSDIEKTVEIGRIVFEKSRANLFGKKGNGRPYI